MESRSSLAAEVSQHYLEASGEADLQPAPAIAAEVPGGSLFVLDEPLSAVALEVELRQATSLLLL